MHVWKKKVVSIVTVLGTLLIVYRPLYAAGSTHIGYVISQKILVESAAGQDFIVRKEQLEAKKRQEIKQEIDVLNELRDEAGKKQMFLNLQAKEKMEDDIQRKEKEITRMKEDSVAELKKFVKNAMRRMNEEASEIIMKIGEEEKFDFIIDINSRANNVVYINPEFDITDRVLEMYNQQYNAKKNK